LYECYVKFIPSPMPARAQLRRFLYTQASTALTVFGASRRIFLFNNTILIEQLLSEKSG
jgi:hypothetical protein